MADVKKIATRESYGNTLKELAAEGHEDRSEEHTSELQSPS